MIALSFRAAAVQENSWKTIEKEGAGQEVYFHAWGGSQEINRYIQWVKKELKARYGVILHHVKVTDIAETSTRLLAEKMAGKEKGGSVDLVWINGENFKSLKDNNMLHGPFVDTLPNWRYVDKSLPVNVDFSEPTQGLEAPWGMGQFVFIYDPKKTPRPPRSVEQLLKYAQENPHRLTYPRPPEFHGVTFLKSLLIALTTNDPRLQLPVTKENYDILTPALWAYLDKFHPLAWRAGKQFPSGTAQTVQLLDDSQIDLAVTFNPNAVYAAQASGNLSDSTQAYAFENGALSNVHFLAIPWNANAKAGALVAINFLLSPQAQSRKGDIAVWGDPSVLKKEYLSGSAKDSKVFKSIKEPHPSWSNAIKKEWLQRYGSQ